MPWHPIEVILDRRHFAETGNVFPAKFEAYPRVWTHVTALENFEKIRAQGFKPGGLGCNYFAKDSSRGMFHHGGNHFRKVDLCAIAVCIKTILPPPQMIYHAGTKSLCVAPEIQPPIIAYCKILLRN